MNHRDPNIAMVETVVQALGTQSERFVFVGGCATGLLVTDNARPPVRRTTDVDLIVEVASFHHYHLLEKDLREAGFSQDMTMNCRWQIAGVTVDVMPTREEILGFSSRWYSRAVQQAIPYVLPSGARINLITPPLFVATKLEAFAGRGNGDYGVSHDMEDIITLIDARPELPEEIRSADVDVRDYIGEEIQTLLGTRGFVESVSWHLTGDAANQARVPEVIRRLRLIAGI